MLGAGAGMGGRRGCPPEDLASFHSREAWTGGPRSVRTFGSNRPKPSSTGSDKNGGRLGLCKELEAPLSSRTAGPRAGDVGTTALPL